MTDAPRLSRRHVLGGAAALGAGLIGHAPPAASRSLVGAPVGRYDFKEPADNLEAFIRIYGDASGAVNYSFAAGHMYAALGDQALPQVLCPFQAIRASEFLRRDDGAFDQRYTALIVCTDNDGVALSSFTNPVNGHQGEVAVRGGGVSIQRHSAAGTRRVDVASGAVASENPFSYGALDPFLLEWTGAGDVGWCYHPTPFVMFDFPWVDATSYRFALSDLDKDMDNVPSTYSYYGESPFYPWLGFEPGAGFAAWLGFGAKCSAPEDLPAAIRRNVSQFHPRLLADPDQWQS